MSIQLRSTQYIREKRATGRQLITADYVHSRLKLSPETGVLTTRIATGGLSVGQQVGTINQQGYRQVFIDYWAYRASRVIYLMMEGEWPPEGYYIDHVNGVRDDDRWCNLRLATPTENARNRAPSKRNTSGVLGVHPIKRSGNWGAEIGVNGSKVRLGCFEIKEDAIAARCAAEKHLYGKFARGAG